MNLHTVVAPAISAVNPLISVTLRRDVGFTTNPDFSRTPTYATFALNAQIQGLQSDDIRLLNGLGIQGYRRKVYLWGSVTGLVRGLQKGNDLLTFPDGSEWKVAIVVEDYGHGLQGKLGWCSVIVVLQNPTSEG